MAKEENLRLDPVFRSEVELRKLGRALLLLAGVSLPKPPTKKDGEQGAA